GKNDSLRTYLRPDPYPPCPRMFDDVCEGFLVDAKEVEIEEASKSCPAFRKGALHLEGYPVGLDHPGAKPSKLRDQPPPGQVGAVDIVHNGTDLRHSLLRQFGYG